MLTRRCFRWGELRAADKEGHCEILSSKCYKTEHDNWVHGISFAPDGKTFVTVSGHVGDNLHVYNTADIRISTEKSSSPTSITVHAKKNTQHDGGVMGVAHSQSGELLVTVSMDRYAHVFAAKDVLSNERNDLTPLKKIATEHTGLIAMHLSFSAL